MSDGMKEHEKRSEPRRRSGIVKRPVTYKKEGRERACKTGETPKDGNDRVTKTKRSDRSEQESERTPRNEKSAD